MIETFPWQQFRQIIIYPVIMVAGIGWGIIFLLQWRVCTSRRFATLMPSLLGFSLAAWASMAILALWVAGRTGFSQLSSALVTIGILTPALVLASAVVYSLMVAWRRATWRIKL